VILEALRVGRALTVGFVNHGFWKNRINTLMQGRKIRNEVYTTEWFESRPANPVTIADFENFCAVKGIRIARREHLAGNWHDRLSDAAEFLRRVRAVRFGEVIPSPNQVTADNANNADVDLRNPRYPRSINPAGDSMNVRQLCRALFTSVPRAPPADCFARIRSGTALLVDVREEREWRRGVADHAVLLPLSDLIRARRRWTPFLKAVSGRELVLYCGVGARAAIAGKLLAAEGFRPVNAGRLKEWIAAGWRVMPPR
jgi:rhodanese-related sulfurtransferase